MDRHAQTRVLIAGAGVAALEAALALRELAHDLVAVELLAPEPYFWYRPLAVGEPFSPGRTLHFELSDLARAAGATFTLGALAEVDVHARVAHSSAGLEIPYDLLLVACGAVPATAIAGAMPFRGPADVDKVQGLLADVEAGTVRRLAFAVPWGAVWSLPAYELALLTAAHAEARGLAVELAIVTPEERPLHVFGDEAAAAVTDLLAQRGIAVRARTYALAVNDGVLQLAPDGEFVADRVVALPRLLGPRIDGLPQTVEGFLPVDEHGRVHGLDDVFAAGDATTFPVKQGGIAAQQADAAAESIAAAVGAGVSPQPFRPVLRGLLLTGGRPRFLRRELAAGPGLGSVVDTEPLWWPPAKIVGQRLAPFLGLFSGTEMPGESPPPPPGALPVDVELDAEEEPPRRPYVDVAGDDERSVAEVMVREVLAVAPEDTLGEIAERMRDHAVGSAVVVDEGRLVGMLTSRDLLRAFAGRVHASEARAREWMTAEPIAVSPDSAVEAAARLMMHYGFHQLPVVEGERVVGVLGLRQAVGSVVHPTGIGLGL